MAGSFAYWSVGQGDCPERGAMTSAGTIWTSGRRGSARRERLRMSCNAWRVMNRGTVERLHIWPHDDPVVVASRQDSLWVGYDLAG